MCEASELLVELEELSSKDMPGILNDKEGTDQGFNWIKQLAMSALLQSILVVSNSTSAHPCAYIFRGSAAGAMRTPLTLVHGRLDIDDYPCVCT